MEILLTDHEVRLLGCLIEKEMATPDYYPLTLNALIAACNQKSNRNPVVAFDEDTVLYALNGLLENKMVRQSNLSRVAKYEQIFSDSLNLVAREKAVVCVLMLRGSQTIGEIRNRTERLYCFNNLEEVEKTLDSLEDSDLVKKLPRQPGHKESRYIHLLQGMVKEPEMESSPGKEASKVIVRKVNTSEEELQKQIDELRRELQQLKEDFAAFRSQFE